ncbi:MAG: hypothetical protein V3V25_08990 [Paracoccaceae bacterium]
MASIATAPIDSQNGSWVAGEVRNLCWVRRSLNNGVVGLGGTLSLLQDMPKLLVFLIERVAMMVVTRPACYFQTVPQYGCAVCQRGTSGCPTLAFERPAIT